MAPPLLDSNSEKGITSNFIALYTENSKKLRKMASILCLTVSGAEEFT